ncbi:MAG TPA: hypothetical protein VLI55_04240 [Bryobacteraceae bacterium]|nr:hypothetical protein [Bryobacteraceae bacterium]
MFWDADETQLSTPQYTYGKDWGRIVRPHSVPKTGAQIGITKPLSNQRLTNPQMRGQNRDVSGTGSPGQDVTFRIADKNKVADATDAARRLRFGSSVRTLSWA